MSILRNIGLILMGICYGGLLQIPYIGIFYFVIGLIGILMVIISQHSNQIEKDRVRFMNEDGSDIYWIEEPKRTHEVEYIPVEWIS